ncbi:MAG: HAD family phosphatase [Verrucomicrobiota bacterium]
MSTTIAFDRARYDGYIFDMDGTLVDSMPSHLRAWKEAIVKFGGDPAKFTEEYYYAKAGQPTRSIMAEFERDFGWDWPVDEATHYKDERAKAHLGDVTVIQPVMEVVRSLPDRPKAVASGNFQDTVELTLRTVGIRDEFTYIIGSDRVPRGKPHPDLFLNAAEGLGVAPERCLVFEDGVPGMKAAEAAGMDWIDVRPFYLHDDHPSRLHVHTNHPD